MFADFPLRKLAYLDWKIGILPSRPMEIFFLKGTMILILFLKGTMILVTN